MMTSHHQQNIRSNIGVYTGELIDNLIETVARVQTNQPDRETHGDFKPISATAYRKIQLSAHATPFLYRD